MKVQDLTLTDELRDIVQIGIITDDIERTKKGMLEVFGLEPDAGGHSVYKKSVYRDGKVFIPSGHDVLRGGDAIVVMTKHSGFGDIDDILV